MPSAADIEMVLLGAVAGLVGGLLGIGGSVIMIPGMAMIFDFTSFHLHQAAALITNVFVAGPSVIRHRTAGAIQRRVVIFGVPTALAGAFLGVSLAELPVFRGSGQGRLQIMFAVFIIVTVLDNARRLLKRRKQTANTGSDAVPNESHPLIVMSMVGLPTGLLGGLLGVGGGLIAVPIQQMVLRLPLRTAIANSAVLVFCAAIFAAFLKNRELANHGYTIVESLKLAVLLLPGAMIGGWIGAGLVHRLPMRALRLAFVLFLSAAAYRMIVGGVENLQRDNTVSTAPMPGSH